NDLTAISASMAELASRHRDTPMIGRSNLQQAVPVTFGYKMAGLLSAIERHRARLAELRPRVLMGEFAGAAGTLASLGQGGLETQAGLMKELGLAQPAIAWHTLRDTIAEVGCFLGLVTGTLGKLAMDAKRMRANLDSTKGLVVSEAVMMGLAPYLGRERAHDLVYDLCREAIRQDRPLLDLLSENAAITKHVDRKKLSELCDPSNYLGLSGVMVDRVLERIRAAPLIKGV